MKNVISSITNRHSPRAFSDKVISSDDLNLLFEAARWAPSAYNSQPWRFVVGNQSETKDVYDSIFDSLVDFNKQWAVTSPVLIAVLANTMGPKGAKNNHAWYDTGQAVSNLSGQATAMEIVLHQMSGFDPAGLSRSLNLSEGIEPIAIIAAGYQGEIKILPENIQEIEFTKIRERKPLSEIVFDKVF